MSGQRPPPTDGLVPRRVCPARPILGTWARLGSHWARLPHAGLAGECALCVFSLCKTCFIRDIELHRPMAWFPGAYVLRALSWAHGRVWGATGRGCHTPAWPGSAHFVCFPYVNRPVFGTASSTDRWPGSQARMSCAPYPGHMGASGEPLGAAATRRLGRGVRTLCVFPM
jgi:hypothetical protein